MTAAITRDHRSRGNAPRSAVFAVVGTPRQSHAVSKSRSTMFAMISCATMLHCRCCDRGGETPHTALTGSTQRQRSPWRSVVVGPWPSCPTLRILPFPQYDTRFCFERVRFVGYPVVASQHVGGIAHGIYAVSYYEPLASVTSIDEVSMPPFPRCKTTATITMSTTLRSRIRRRHSAMQTADLHMKTPFSMRETRTSP